MSKIWGGRKGMRILVGSLLWMGSVLAQTRDTASVFGSVSDSQAALIPGVTVTLTSIATGQVRAAVTNDSGGYLFSLLPVGSYNIAVEHAGFRRYEQRNILLQANENVKVDVVLEVGNVQETVTVDALATQVETRSSTLKETVDRRRVVELPLNGRNPADLALLVPGVLTTGNNTGDLGVNNIRPRGQKQLTVNGSRNNNLRYTLDGGENMDNLFQFNLPFPFPDALQEFSIQTSNMTMEHGNSSAGVVNVVTKSGTNDLHGDIFWFVRNTALNASNFFSRQQDQLKRNQTGATIGGPIRKNKIFGFGGFQKLWIRQAAGDSRAQSLTAAERRGDFSTNPIAIFDPLTGQRFPNNTIPQNRLSRASLNLLGVAPLPDADGFTRYTFAFPEDGEQYIARVDYVHSAKHNIAFRYFENNQTNPYHSPPDNIFASRTGGYQNSRNATLSYNYIHSPTLLAHTQLTGLHLVSVAESDFPKRFSDFGVKAFSPSNDISTSILNSGGGMGVPPRVGFARATEEFQHDWTWTKGNHTFTWGTQLIWRQYNEDTIFRSSGYFEFDGHVTGSGDQPGFDRADFMLGGFSYFTQNNGELENRRGPLRGFYFGDVWRLTRRFTINYGLRYEPYTFFTDLKDRNQTFFLPNYEKGIRSKVFLNAPPGLLYHGDDKPAGYPGGGSKIGKSVTEPDLNNLAPRFGFAWDPFGDGKTSIRAGYAIFYDGPSLQAQNDANNVSPFSYSVQFYDGIMDDPYLGREKSNRFPVAQFLPDTPFDDPLYTIVLNPKYVSPYTQNWNFTAEREVFRDTRLRLGYVGTKATHLKSEWDRNAPIYDTTKTLAQNRANIEARRPIKGYDEISQWFHGLNSSYHALQVSVDKRYSRGFTVLASYTWSKTLDYISVNGFGGGNRVSNPFNFFFARSAADQHRPQRFVGSFVWDLPAPATSNGVVKAIAHDWKLSGILTLQSGRPFTIGATGNPVAGAGSARVDLIGQGNPVLDAGRSKGEKVAAFFDTKRFQNPPPNTYGTLGRNALEGPGFSNVDISLVKGFRLPFLGEAGLGQFRFEAFNLFNRTNFSNPNTGITNTLFGRLTGTDGDPRILQFALKFSF